MRPSRDVFRCALVNDIAAGSPAELMQDTTSITGKYLVDTRPTTSPIRRRGNGKKLVIRGACAHNLKNVTVEFPLGRLIAITGVSGSGKSSLMFDILNRAAQQHFYHASAVPGPHDAIEGWEHLDDAITIDQIA
ncbi:MAG TPA: hypothetical protein VHO69_10970, partial [Phototrophicaceae bacterium]|nr:hypothetical protein [Phototrophicaceae bacterium]